MATIISRDPAETLELGRGEGARCQAGDVIALCGDLGAGKTQFVKGLADGLATSGDVTSPTFTLIHEYAGGRLPLHHFDLYRLGSAAEALPSGKKFAFEPRHATRRFQPSPRMRIPRPASRSGSTTRGL